jgi:hypothetical protein
MLVNNKYNEQNLATLTAGKFEVWIHGNIKMYLVERNVISFEL